MAIFTIRIYQMFFSPILSQLVGAKGKCRYSLCCSEYAKQAIQKYGIVKGGYYGLKRFISCQPFFSIQV